MHADDFASGRASESHAVVTRSGQVVSVDVSRLRGVGRMLGKRVRLVGDNAGSVFVASGSTDVSSPQATTVALSMTTNAASPKVAIILVNFRNDTSQPWTKTTVQSTVFGDSNSVADYFREVSYGNTRISGSIFGWVTVPYDNTGCRYGEWSTAALAASGIDSAAFTQVVYAFPRTPDCRWAGATTVGGKSVWINGAMTVRTVGHELAHTMGVHHASALQCTNNGARVTWSSTCTKSEYGDPFSIMGAGTRHLHHWHRAQIGWLPEVQTVSTSGTYSVAASELAQQPRLVRVARGDGTFLYFEFRQPFGTFETFTSTSPATKGVTVRIAPDKPSRVQSLLLDMTPGTYSFEDSALTVGRSFTDPKSGVTVTTTAVSSAEASISVRFPGTTLPSSPTPAPTATSTPSPTPTPTATATPTPTPTRTPTPTATAAPTPTPSASPTASPSPTASSTPSSTPTPTPTASPSAVPVTATLTAPTYVRASRLDGRRVKVTWRASSGPVAGYRVYREGVYIGRTSYLRFYDRVPDRMRWPTYYVRPIDASRSLGPRSRAFTLFMP